MDEHIGITSKVAAAILHKNTLVRLLQAKETQAGTAQRLHNILLLYPSLLSSSVAQKQVFQCAEAVARIITRWDETTCRQTIAAAADESTQADSSADALSRIYIIALMQLLLSLRGSFSAKQQSRFEEWAQLLAARGLDATPVVAEMRLRFLTHQPFADMNLSSFRVPGLKQAHLHPGRASSAPATASVESTAEDIPFSFLPRTACPQCGRSQPFYCTYCYIVVHEKAKGMLPTVNLPITVDIVLHPAVLRHKSTALQTLLLAHPHGRVEEHTYPSLPVYDPATTAVIFPSDEALTVAQLATSMSQARSATDHPPVTPPVQLTSLRRVIFLEGTWDEARLMLQHANLRHLTHLRLDTGGGVASSSSVAPAAASTSAVDSAPVSPVAVASPSTAFWRYQKFGAGFLSSIEAIYHLLAQFHPHQRTLTNDDEPQAQAANGVCPYDDLLWLFAMSYGRVQSYYRQHPTLLPPIMHGAAHADA